MWVKAVAELTGGVESYITRERDVPAYSCLLPEAHCTFSSVLPSLLPSPWMPPLIISLGCPALHSLPTALLCCMMLSGPQQATLQMTCMLPAHQTTLTIMPPNNILPKSCGIMHYWARLSSWSDMVVSLCKIHLWLDRYCCNMLPAKTACWWLNHTSTKPEELLFIAATKKCLWMPWIQSKFELITPYWDSKHRLIFWYYWNGLICSEYEWYAKVMHLSEIQVK